VIEILDTMVQGSEEWFGARCGSLGASSVKDACAGGKGLTRKTLACNLVAESYTGEKTKIFQNDAMKWGVETEPQAREYFEFVNGVSVKEVGMVRNSNFPGSHASPDGLFNDTGVEIKCCQPTNFIKYLLANKLPAEYRHQVQFTMMICEFDHYWFMSYHPAFPKQLIVKIDRDDKFINEMQEKLKIFFDEMSEIKAKIK